MSSLLLNKTLITNAELQAKGNNIHSINEAICNYEAWYNVATGNAWFKKYPLSKEKQEEAIRQTKNLEIYLSKLILGTTSNKDKPKVII